MHWWDDLEIVLGRRRTGGPLESPAFPRIISGRSAVSKADPNIDKQHDDGNTKNECADGRSEIHGRPARPVRIRVNAAGHAIESEYVLDQKCQMESDEHQPEM